MIDPVAFQIGSITVRWYGILISMAVLIGLLLTFREAERKGIEQEFFLDLFIYSIPVAIIGARLYYVIFSWSTYRYNLAKVFSIREGGLAIHGAIIAGLVVFYLMAKRRQVPFGQVIDTVAPALVLGQAIGRWGNFINQEAYGSVVSKEFIAYFPSFIQRQMLINGNYYHPAFLYESVWNFLLFIFLLVIKSKDFIKDGDLFLFYVIGYSLGRFFIEGIRLDSLMLGPFRVAQLISLLAILTGGIILYLKHRKGMGFDAG
ncbi:MAG: prolipoprotein diacylglyceryl transferase [Halanaerobiales bacterium]|nr:prolipoprotein diacylglyceryl transferase [Halanaerobiales bacterium]